ncbi:hypothetical protein [Streptomyces sp. NPDC003710]
MEGWKFWWGVAAFFLGGLATQLNGWLTYRRHRADRRADAADALRKRREEFELQHLVEVNQLLRIAIERLFEHSTAERRYRASREMDPHDLEPRQRAEEAATAFDTALQDVTSQLPFILADEIRQPAGDLVVHMAQAAALLTGGGLVDGAALSVAADRVYEPLGERVRAIYAGQVGT